MKPPLFGVAPGVTVKCVSARICPPGNSPPCADASTARRSPSIFRPNHVLSCAPAFVRSSARAGLSAETQIALLSPSGIGHIKTDLTAISCCHAIAATGPEPKKPLAAP